MNQILYTGGKKGKSPKTGSKSSIQKIIVFFVIVIVIFGIALIEKRLILKQIREKTFKTCERSRKINGRIFLVRRNITI